MVKIKGKPFLYRPDWPLGFQQFGAPKISR
jgi:hypothetical protein